MWLTELEGLNSIGPCQEMGELQTAAVIHIGPVRPASVCPHWCFESFTMQHTWDCTEHICDSDSFREMILYLVSQHEAKYFPTCANHTRALLPGGLGHLPQKETHTIFGFSGTALLASWAHRLELTTWCPSFEKEASSKGLVGWQSSKETSERNIHSFIIYLFICNFREVRFVELQFTDGKIHPF